MTIHKNKPKRTRFFLLLAMSTLFLLSFLSLLLFFTQSASADHHHHHPKPPPQSFKPPSPKSSGVSAAPLIIQQACKATRFQQPCESSLGQPGRVEADSTPVQIIQAAIGVSSENLKKANSMVQSILDSSASNVNRSTAAKNCLEVLRNSDYRISMANDAVPRGKMKDARAWMSAALLFQYDCWSALKYANDTHLVNETMSFLDSLTGLSSNALSMMASYDVFGTDVSKWGPPKTERDGFWASGSSGSEMGSRGGFPSKLTADATVCKDGGDGCYKTVQEAVNAAPNNGVKKFVIHIKAGVYEETVRVPLEKKNVVFLGDGMGKTVITGSLNVGQPGISTYNTATVGVLGDGFMANGLTFQNTAGPEAHQAVAFRSDSDLSVIENCEFLGNQDTLYAHSLRQFYKSCRIQGNVDFIFGNSASFFQDCQILVCPRQIKPEKGENNAVTAHGRTDPAQTTGFVFQNCLINGTEDYMKLYHSKPAVHKNFLGRPWKEYSRTVFVHCNLEALITPQGWMPWSQDFALKTLFYGEFDNSGPGSDLSQRVSWSSRIPAEHVSVYSVQSFIQGDDWIPSNYDGFFPHKINRKTNGGK
ncbi:probable pectinesterase/pectinesterase inhibitor 51 [Cannabis sativa]|uniref:probable pectinesterase/pectinesterase inhibitor 51 n=1 Tax=Cannabis sativa TaxID=3483 RepID=UPI0029CA39BE|nr:probable pectinesterase/pectinesterase inhibitor 51 [Cannabis sativa]